jgi:hypothetical protein
MEMVLYFSLARHVPIEHMRFDFAPINPLRPTPPAGTWRGTHPGNAPFVCGIQLGCRANIRKPGKRTKSFDAFRRRNVPTGGLKE